MLHIKSLNIILITKSYTNIDFQFDIKIDSVSERHDKLHTTKCKDIINPYAFINKHDLVELYTYTHTLHLRILQIRDSQRK